jgi:exodeoxyribonuclease III
MILCIQESKIDEERMIAENLKDKFPAEYLQYWNCCKPPIRGYAGTIIFTRIKPISVVYDIGIAKHDREGRTITLEFDKFFLVGVYVPNSGATLKWHEYRTNEWDLDFRAYLKGLERKGKPVVLAGDLNVAHQDIDIYDPKRNEQMACFTPAERQSFSNFVRMGFTDTFRELYPGKIKYSFWDIRDKSRKENKGWRLDYVMISNSAMHAVKDSEIHNEYWGSDHCPVSMTLDATKIDLKQFTEDLKNHTEEYAEDEERKSDLDMEDNINGEFQDDIDSGHLDPGLGIRHSVGSDAESGLRESGPGHSVEGQSRLG